ncbi:ras association domain-containing protein 5 isoform X1 [Hippocampus comes]|uniref:ras association domain-containing protein 5 isoform X1 n=1 Tax=Hippocampus comes TaxID=109280 RepID=UPI00094E28A4|nr:PREDICTED: ras association domain-containing protein 5 isoform X1 [Hippocampus comes]
MASASVVGQHPAQHRLDSEPLLRVFKPAASRKKITLPRKSSWEKMMLRRCGSVTAANQAGTCHLPVGPTGDTAVATGGSPTGGCRRGASSAPASPRSPDQARQQGSVRSDWSSPAGGDSRDRNAKAALQCAPVDVTNSASVASRHRQIRHSGREHTNKEVGHQGIFSSVSARDENGGLPLERLTQGRTGVVRLARTEPPRREAWAIFPLPADKGAGHRFEAKAVTQDWCDACSRQITAQALECQNCTYTCHLECERQVQLDCNQRDHKPEETQFPRSRCSTPKHKKSEAKEEEEGGVKDLPEEEVRTRIEEYNARVSENGMKLASDGSYTGFIKVHLRLSRPVTVPAMEVPVPGGPDGSPSEGRDCGQGEDRTSFYLPCDCVKQLHISSTTTTREVIQGLLKKFMVLDNPRKFALYRQTHRDGQDLFQKLPLCERPLLLRLIAGPDPERLSFVLKENETGEVEWHAFSVPELQNFLVILDKEEAERVRAVQSKYTMYRRKLQQALQQHDP